MQLLFFNSHLRPNKMRFFNDFETYLNSFPWYKNEADGTCQRSKKFATFYIIYCTTVENASTVRTYYRKNITLFCALNVLGVNLPDVHYNSFFRCLIYLKFRLWKRSGCRDVTNGTIYISVESRGADTIPMHHDERWHQSSHHPLLQVCRSYNTKSAMHLTKLYAVPLATVASIVAAIRIYR